MRNKTILLLGAAIAVGALGATAMGQNATPGTSGPFTGPQAAAGHQAYENNCAPCHLQDMSGTNDAPALAGTPFMGAWGKRSTAALYSKIATTMPLGAGGSLSEKQYTDIVAYILERNGARAGCAAIDFDVDAIRRRDRERERRAFAAQLHQALRETRRLARRIAAFERRKPLQDAHGGVRGHGAVGWRGGAGGASCPARQRHVPGHLDDGLPERRGRNPR